jgi:hypothetical protein
MARRDAPDDADRRHLLELEQERWRRECRRNLIAFAAEALHSGNQLPAHHHKLICARLMRLVGGDLPAVEEWTDLNAHWEETQRAA